MAFAANDAVTDSLHGRCFKGVGGLKVLMIPQCSR